ncbi:hypothetical protein N7449_003534 [Penicillium cf. viridicatum]|uniref:Cytochrome P450 n=1 Tax=Penicillium cf. viridicatum TaxID=2972119 RepID=A0A9W9MX52_9EURO|nr:hypothetical protein N7449_003534 [Penicillium cf. viridicatum]
MVTSSPPGTIVGMNPYIVARNKAVWGDDPEEFLPERWLRDVDGGEMEEDYQVRLSKMNAAELAFAQGSRVCLGKPMGLSQSHKVLVTLAARYKIELSPDVQWETGNSTVIRPKGLRVRISKR